MNQKAKICIRLVSCLAAPFLLGCPERANIAGDYIGEWWNDDRKTEYITRIIVEPWEDDQDLNDGDWTFLRVHIFSACDSDECDWGTGTGWFLVTEGIEDDYDLIRRCEFEDEEVRVKMLLDRSTRVLTVLERHEYDYGAVFEITHSFHEHR